MNKLSGKTTIITGAGSGIGKAIAIAFAQEGSNLILASRNTESLNNTRDQIKKSGGNAIVVPTDVSKESDVINLFKTSTQEFDKIDILINNSGVMEGGSLENLSLKTWNNVINVNLTGVFLCSREAFKIMKSQGNGRIINIGSISAQMPRINSLPYSTSKHGIVGLTKSNFCVGSSNLNILSCFSPIEQPVSIKTAMILIIIRYIIWVRY